MEFETEKFDKKEEKISSLHDDVYVPKSTGHLGEYKSYPERFDPNEKSVITRLEQFGISVADVEKSLGKRMNELTWNEYNALMAEVIKGRYDVIVASVFDQYMFPSSESPEEQDRKMKMLELTKQFENMETRCGINLVKHGRRFGDRANVVLSLEAGAHLIKSVDDVRDLAEKGIRIFGLQYGDNNMIAGTNGLTAFGKSIVEFLFDRNLIVDLAHSSFKTRRDVLNLAKEKNKGYLISYTHGSSEEDVVESWKEKVGERPLKQDEIREIIKMGGIVGLGISKPFFENTRKIAERIDSISQLENGIDGIAIGTDFGGIAPEWLNEIKSPKDFDILGDILSQDFGMKDDNIKKVVRLNVKRWIKSAID